MLICKDCRCYHPVSVSDIYCGECCIGETRNPIAINADIVGCCLFEPKQPKKRISNADRIRQMTDEELAEFIDKVTDCCSDGWMCDKCPMYDADCAKIEGFIAWLKMEVNQNDG